MDNKREAAELLKVDVSLISAASVSTTIKSNLIYLEPKSQTVSEPPGGALQAAPCDPGCPQTLQPGQPPPLREEPHRRSTAATQLLPHGTRSSTAGHWDTSR